MRYIRRHEANAILEKQLALVQGENKELEIVLREREQQYKFLMDEYNEHVDSRRAMREAMLASKNTNAGV